MEDIRDTPLYREILQGCPGCPWQSRKRQTVPPSGPVTSPLMVVGRNPGRQEDEIGAAFVGISGQCLTFFLGHCGIDRKRVYITNTGKCHGGPGDPCPDAAVFDCCESFLEKEIALVRPRLIIPVGADAYRRLTGDVDSIVRVQGKVARFRYLPDRAFFPITHPSYWLRTPGYYARTIFPEVVPALVRTLKELEIYDLVKKEGK